MRSLCYSAHRQLRSHSAPPSYSSRCPPAPPEPCRPVWTVPPESHELRGFLPSPETSRVQEPPGLEVFQDSLSMSGVEERLCPQASLEAYSVPKLIQICPGCRSFLDPSSRARFPYNPHTRKRNRGDILQCKGTCAAGLRGHAGREVGRWKSALWRRTPALRLCLLRADDSYLFLDLQFLLL